MVVLSASVLTLTTKQASLSESFFVKPGEQPCGAEYGPPCFVTQGRKGCSPRSAGTKAESVSRTDGRCCCSQVPDEAKPLKKDVPKKKLLTRTVETFYDYCAAYNLRYIPYRTSCDRGKCLNNAFKDMVMLLCFLAANLVVLLTILAKLAIHLSGVFLDTLDWLLHVSQESQLKKRLAALLHSDSQGAEKLGCCPRVVE